MLYAFGFERVGVVVGDLYFVDPRPAKGQEGAEHGVRVELRVLQRGPLKGSIYSAQPIEVARPIWRADLLETVDGRPGSFDRTHYHPVFRDWDPTSRVFARELSADPLGWLGEQLADLDALLAAAGFPPGTAAPDDADRLRGVAPEIVDAARRLLDQVRAGKLGTAPRDPAPNDQAPHDPAPRDTAPHDTAPQDPTPAGKPVAIRAGWL
ncbi:MAG: hypothetical protein WAL72_35335 [Streptosporangiaceae bacterium]